MKTIPKKNDLLELTKLKIRGGPRNLSSKLNFYLCELPSVETDSSLQSARELVKRLDCGCQKDLERAGFCKEIYSKNG